MGYKVSRPSSIQNASYPIYYEASAAWQCSAVVTPSPRVSEVSEVSDCGFERHTIDYAFAVLNNYPFKLEVELSLHI